MMQLDPGQIVQDTAELDDMYGEPLDGDDRKQAVPTAGVGDMRYTSTINLPGTEPRP